MEEEPGDGDEGEKADSHEDGDEGDEGDDVDASVVVVDVSAMRSVFTLTTVSSLLSTRAVMSISILSIVASGRVAPRTSSTVESVFMILAVITASNATFNAFASAVMFDTTSAISDPPLGPSICDALATAEDNAPTIEPTTVLFCS